MPSLIPYTFVATYDQKGGKGGSESEWPGRKGGEERAGRAARLAFGVLGSKEEKGRNAERGEKIGESWKSRRHPT